MNPIIEAHLDEIIEFCKKYSVSRLELFGSALSGEFNPERSDFDFLVEYSEDFDYSRYFDLKDDLETLLGRNVELVTRKYLRNPYFIYAVESTKIPLYAAYSGFQ